jgi:7-keto-8-aminopelargonate synthetase-like enzyme
MEFVSPADGPYVTMQGKKYLDFSSCDFLGLAQHPEVKKAAIKYTLKYGVGIPVSPLGSSPQQQLEGKLAQFLGTEAAVLFPSFEEAQQILKNLKATILSSETHDLPKKKPPSLLCIDDSSMIGIAGEHGFGVAAHQSGFDLITGSLANGAGCSGAYIAGSKKVLNSLNASQPLSFPVLGALDSALSFIPEMSHEREILTKNNRWLQKLMRDLPVKMLKSPKALLEFKSEKDAQQVRHFLAEDQIYLAPPVGNTLYIAMTALHTPDDLDQLTVSLKKMSETDLVLAMQSLTPTP